MKDLPIQLVGRMSLLAVSLREDDRLASVMVPACFGNGSGVGLVGRPAAPRRSGAVHDKVLDVVSFDVVHDKVHG